jgi:hypothetical protein
MLDKILRWPDEMFNAMIHEMLNGCLAMSFVLGSVCMGFSVS